ncbi:speckle-type POZ protein-like B [Caerostris extrusa]|uniref:Speckle-type POZ protein-like B n=1 Tax=Caerostris extrusa TaxID=172846 RepID=A0AAV4T3V1_CAEEX|nr:speckle-type POZ protein-like B [Caerostris extrusa]
MAGRGSDGRKCSTIIWIIENFRFYWQNLEECLISPIFDFENLENTKWHLSLYPRGHVWEDDIDIVVIRGMGGPKLINLDFEIVFSSMTGTVYKKECLRDVCFDEDGHQHVYATTKRCKISHSNKNLFLRKESLVVQCRMWRTDGATLKGEQIIARTVAEIQRRSFIWDIKYLTLNQSFENTSLSVTLLGKKAVLNLSPLLKEGTESVEETFSVKLTSGREKYLPNDVLSLQCDIAISTGDTTNRIEGFITGIDDDICKQNFETYESVISPDLKADLKSMYREGTLSDTQIRTSTETFPAHTQILGARSAVFRAMFSADMKERTKECVDITDLDSETVRRMLLYMYTDTLEEDLQCQSACQLYAAADKYAVLSLKNRCSSILVSIIDHNNACDILSLTDRHQDEELKKSGSKYILQNDNVFRTNEWKLLMKSNSQLASETMYLQYCDD